MELEKELETRTAQVTALAGSIAKTDDQQRRILNTMIRIVALCDAVLTNKESKVKAIDFKRRVTHFRGAIKQTSVAFFVWHRELHEAQVKLGLMDANRSTFGSMKKKLGIDDD